MTITAAADGSALGNPGPAGWAWYIDDDTWRAGGWVHGTNNMGELKAVLDLLEATADEPGFSGRHLLILCDSQYVINSVTKWMPGWKRKGWKKKDGKPVQNVELMKAIDAAMQGRDVTFEWVKGHAGHPMNEAADKRANNAATAFSQGRRPDTGPGLEGHVAGEATGTATAVEGTGGTEAPEDTESTGDAAERELALYTQDVRSDRDAAASLLHPDLTAIRADGTLRDRVGFLDDLRPLRGFDRLEVSDMITEVLGQGSGCVLVRYTTSGAYGSVSCSSVWVRHSGAFLLRHHQQTRRS